jgi:hypothetical protein
VKNFEVSHLGFFFAAAITIWGCKGSSGDAPKTPLGQSPPASIGASRGGTTTPAGMGDEAKTALDSGNILYRAKAYGLALAQYRRSAQLSPTEAAPLLGILMVADVTKNAKLADSTLARVRALSPGADSSPAMSQAEIRAIHAGVMKTAPPPPEKKK